MKYYPLGDDVPNIPRNEQSEWMAKLTVSGGGVEFRPPKKGEWYLSGSIPVAYRAPNDFTQSYHIMKIVRIKKTIVIEEIEYIGDEIARRVTVE